MARLLEHPNFVPCPACGNTVSKSFVTVQIKAGKGVLIIENVPQYECECGSLFVPQETESLISELQNDKNLLLNGKTKTSYEDIRRKGIKGIKKG